jgi:tetrahydromethanopterin S-methyltransferase subunit B
LLFSSSILSAQTADDKSLNSQYELMKKQSNNYQIYKVVKESTLDEFWKTTRDSLQKERAEIKNLSSDMAQLRIRVTELEATVTQRDAALEEQKHMIDNMDFMGISLTKGAYKTVSWVLILALAAAALILFIRFSSANRITVQSKRDYQILQEEFETHRLKTRENESKLKRDLQTEINKFEELKEKLGKK